MIWQLIFAITIAAVLTAGTTIAIGVLAYFAGEAIKKQAQKEEKKFFAPFPRPGSLSFVALEGNIERILENVGGWHLAPQPTLGGGLCFVLGDRELSEDPLQKILQTQLGVQWIGLYQTIKIIKNWKWTEFRQTQVDGKPVFQIVSREENVQEFFFQFQYPVTLEDAEINGNIRVKVEAVFIVLHLFPVRAFFLNKDPIAIFNAMTQGLTRRFIRNLTFDQVKGLNADKNSGDKSFWEEIDRLNGLKLDDLGQPMYETADPNGLFGKLGYYIARGEIPQVSGVGDAAKAIEAAEVARLQGDGKVAEAERLAEARRQKAKGDADALDLEREARKRWVNDTIVGPTGGAGPHVADVLISEQVANSDVTTWVAGGSHTQPSAIIAIPPSSGKGKKSSE